ncbi:MAG: ribbon-helix-helix protein, CopG family [Gemmobacter sp.]|jgi:metal-responsive CopG/Arc/MetJ family transcriptional regulator|nr:ribbon-helix-helix protein, CopG family [Gemmobacter sp.]
MNASTHDNTKRRKRPVETGTLVGVRLQADLLSGLDAAAEAAGDEPSRPEMIRRIAATYLRERGYLPK